MKKYKLRGWYSVNWAAFGLGFYYQSFGHPSTTRCGLYFDLTFLSVGITLSRELEDIEKLW